MLGKNHYETLEDNEKQTLLVDIRCLQFLLHALNNLRKRLQMSLVDLPGRSETYLLGRLVCMRDGLLALVRRVFIRIA